MRLRPQGIRIQAPRELVFDVIASPDGVAVERGEEVVELETRWRGGCYKSTEAVSLQRPHRIGYAWLMAGPGVGVEEEIMLSEIDPRTTELTYRGSFGPPAGVTGWFRSITVVRPIFNRLVRSHLEEAKKLSEARALRPELYRS